MWALSELFREELLESERFGKAAWLARIVRRATHKQGVPSSEDTPQLMPTSIRNTLFLRCCTMPKRADEAMLALLYPNIWEENELSVRAWKRTPWGCV